MAVAAGRLPPPPRPRRPLLPSPLLLLPVLLPPPQLALLFLPPPVEVELAAEFPSNGHNRRTLAFRCIRLPLQAIEAMPWLAFVECPFRQ